MNELAELNEYTIQAAIHDKIDSKYLNLRLC